MIVGIVSAMKPVNMIPVLGAHEAARPRMLSRLLPLLPLLLCPLAARAEPRLCYEIYDAEPFSQQKNYKYLQVNFENRDHPDVESHLEALRGRCVELLARYRLPNDLNDNLDVLLENLAWQDGESAKLVFFVEVREAGAERELMTVLESSPLHELDPGYECRFREYLAPGQDLQAAAISHLELALGRLKARHREFASVPSGAP